MSVAKPRPVRHVSPSIIARWLEVTPETVINWIHARDAARRLPAVDISTRSGRPHYVVFRRDLAAFLLRRGMTEERVRDLLG